MANNFENPALFEEVARQAAGRYVDECAVKLLAFSENATYLAFNPHTEEKLFVLRVGRPGYHELEEYESEISWLRQINDYTPLKVANPIAAKDGSFIQQIAKDSTTYFCIATEFLSGETLEHDDAPDAAVAHYRMLGDYCVSAPADGDLERYEGHQTVPLGLREHNRGNAIWGNWRDYPSSTRRQQPKSNAAAKSSRRVWNVTVRPSSTTALSMPTSAIPTSSWRAIRSRSSISMTSVPDARTIWRAR